MPAVFPKINPLARALLRSPLHGLMSRHVIVLCFEGRRTGKRYETPVAYRRADDGALEALTSVHGAWLRNLEPGALATVVHCGRAVPARVDVVLACASTRSYRVRVRTAGVRCARMIVWVPADAGMTKKRGGDDGRRAGTSVSAHTIQVPAPVSNTELALPE